jgi:hypothetical protein
MVEGLAVMDTANDGFTVTATVEVDVQPLEPAAVTVYVVLDVGDTTAPVDKLPGIMV